MSVPRVAVLIDLPREKASGGHVKYWERIAQAAVACDAPVDLTLYFSGTGDHVILSPRVRYRFLPPVFSTARLPFLPYVPAHTDLASFHPALAAELPNYDVIHTTDAFFAFARTAEKIAAWHSIPLVTSLHTDTPAYAELFTRQTLHSLLGKKWGGWIDKIFAIAAREGAGKKARLKKHLQSCNAILALREVDRDLVRGEGLAEKLAPMRLGVDKKIFTPDSTARAVLNETLSLNPAACVVLFVGRVDAGKNMPLLLQACMTALAQGVALHLIVAGEGPMTEEVQKTLGAHVTLAGFVEPARLAHFYAAADCLAMASDIEIGGMIALEALACGCPVLASRANGAAQALGYPQAMQEVESTPEGWVQALRDVAQDRASQKHSAALAFRDQQLAGWEDVLMQDFMPVWQRLFFAAQAR